MLGISVFCTSKGWECSHRSRLVWKNVYFKNQDSNDTMRIFKVHVVIFSEHLCSDMHKDQ